MGGFYSQAEPAGLGGTMGREGALAQAYPKLYAAHMHAPAP
jgi:hypothetical protein